jgi:clan AA aspartic protease (TIGR02281 family)
VAINVRDLGLRSICAVLVSLVIGCKPVEPQSLTFEECRALQSVVEERDKYSIFAASDQTDRASLQRCLSFPYEEKLAGAAQVVGKLPGRFAAEIGSAGLSVTAKAEDIDCAAHTFPIDLMPTWEQAIKAGLAATLAQVDFVGDALPPSKFPTARYDALLRVLSSSAESRFEVANLSAASEAYVQGRLIVSFPDGSQKEAPIDGTGTASGKFGPLSYGCLTANEVIATAGAMAVKDAAERAMLTTKKLLADHTPGTTIAATGTLSAAAPDQLGPSIPLPSVTPPSVTPPSREPNQISTETAPRNEVKLTKRAGTYMVPVRINDAITLDFLLDTGAADVAIPADVVFTLHRTGTVKISDFVGTETYVLADGSELPSARFILHELKVGDHVVKNVTASMAPARADHPLLGQSFLSKFVSWSIDNERNVLVLLDKPGTR